MAGALNYVKGDATKPAGTDPRFIIHVCNDLGLWGAGFVMALSRRWPEPEDHYYHWKEHVGLMLGAVVPPALVEENLWVVNMIGQCGVGGRQPDGLPPIRYDAVRACLEKVAIMALGPVYRGPFKACSIHCPKFGAGLAGGDWAVIEQIIKEELVDKGLAVTVYEFVG